MYKPVNSSASCVRKGIQTEKIWQMNNVDHDPLWRPLMGAVERRCVVCLLMILVCLSK